jgi:hypothetical protein
MLSENNTKEKRERKARKKTKAGDVLIDYACSVAGIISRKAMPCQSLSVVLNSPIIAYPSTLDFTIFVVCCLGREINQHHSLWKKREFLLSDNLPKHQRTNPSFNLRVSSIPVVIPVA